MLTPSNLNALLPQTQCTECGYQGCLPYAQALSSGSERDWTRCLPGGQNVSDNLTQLAGIPSQLVSRNPESWTAHVQIESCIGCNLCVKVCPVDAFIGILNYEHQVIQEDCTGCKLCLPVCPTQCIIIKERTLPLPTQSNNLANMNRKSETIEAVKDYKMKNHQRTLSKILPHKPLLS